MHNLKALLLTGLTGLTGLLAAPLAGAANLVQNPGFENGDFSGWTIGGDTTGGTSGPFLGVNCTDGVQNSGSCAATFGEPTAATTLSQTFSLAPSQPYTLSFYLQEIGDPSSNYPNTYSVSFNGSLLTTASNVTDSAGAYTKYSYMLNSAASGNSGLLQFSFQNSVGYFVVDDVSLTGPVPEPASYALMLAGLGVFAARGALRRRGPSKVAQV